MAMRRKASALLLGILVGSAAIWSAPQAGAAPSEEPAPAPSTTGAYVPNPLVRYEVSGVGIARRITYQTNDNQRHETDVPLPWSTQLTGVMITPEHPMPYAVSAMGVGPGAISCTLTINGKVVSQYTATGNPARVVCAHH